MKSRALLIALTVSLFSSLTPAIAAEPKVAIAYDIGFLGDNSFNDAVHLALKAAKKKYGLVEPFVREVPTNGTAVDRLTRLRFLAPAFSTMELIGRDELLSQFPNIANLPELFHE